MGFEPGLGVPLRDRYQAPMIEGVLRILHPRWARFTELLGRRPVRGVIDLVQGEGLCRRWGCRNPFGGELTRRAPIVRTLAIAVRPACRDPPVVSCLPDQRWAKRTSRLTDCGPAGQEDGRCAAQPTASGSGCLPPPARRGSGSASTPTSAPTGASVTQRPISATTFCLAPQAPHSLTPRRRRAGLSATVRPVSARAITTGVPRCSTD